MEEEDVVAWTRRSARMALAEIPLRLGQLRVSPPPSPWTPVTNVRAPPSPATPRHALTPRDNSTANLPSSAYISPTPSPDELVIQQRGRKRIPVSWSPDIDSRKQSSSNTNNRTPSKSSLISNGGKHGIVLRSTPKKRLLLNEFDMLNGNSRRSELTETSTPTKHRNHSPSKFAPTPKKLKMDYNIPIDDDVPLETTLKGLSKEQLIDLIKNVVRNHTELEEEIRCDLPQPDLKPYEDNLRNLKRNIFRSLPSTRLTSKTDSPAYARAAVHLVAFKKQLTDQGKILVDSKNWKSVLDYAILSWSFVKATPLWDNHPHNAVRRQCFKYLTNLSMTALKKGHFDKSFLENIYGKFEHMVFDSEDVRICLKWITAQLVV